MFVRKRIQRGLLRHAALLYVFVLAGEEIPDLMQKLAAEHPETDPLLAEVNRYHRQEEARHLAFARMRLPELQREASAWERFRMRHTVPFGIHRLFDSMIDPGVYATVGLPAAADLDQGQPLDPAAWPCATRPPARSSSRSSPPASSTRATCPALGAGCATSTGPATPCPTAPPCRSSRPPDRYSARPTGWSSMIWSRYSDRP